MSKLTDDLKISSMKELISPSDLIKQLPMTDKAINTVVETRSDIINILNGKDERLILVVGPCSIHDVDAAHEYAEKLLKIKKKVEKNILIIMRVYFEKPRTVIGWKGLINDPDLDNSFNINKGIKIARKLLINLAESGIPAGHEYLDLISPQYISDVICWGAIGARTTESQSHRELASGLSCPVGFKNGTDGGIQIAIDAIKAASKAHNFLSVTKEGKSAIFSTSGNIDCHIILRGGKKINYQKVDITNVSESLIKNKLSNNIMIDASHANSQKDHTKQRLVIEDISNQISEGNNSICGVMLESNLVAGRQDIGIKSTLVYGQSITDACIGWSETEELIDMLDYAISKKKIS
ncbi:MAG: 3-deoxy-7-phosphoheptulonate synthase [Gammaproteobacteria bacterium]|nr:3-deoxy-7-phosphoheptulonate synthase [Gammaproteobacteria bacterium]MBT5406357.1 3-deoxy-7-phosphoheptulonate synthase [Gammaproteobacteria bacterium]MBT5644383.1 3-deoxy-7-phosphoheptulonate synthase [Gammaproteobacteria bacterium]MBT6734527.1 3-deoxy-7-phosphoheptulonate synthase [Gammaproteobacteria bacterium]MBT7236484.1 3-deoxy-7-phosphoheptulonate synthase [Gammaproteobacteria bacterium]